MSRSEARSRRYFLLTTALTALLVVAFAVPGSAKHPGSGGIHTEEPVVENDFFGAVPSENIKCTWRHRGGNGFVNSYVCEERNGDGGPWRLSRTNDQGPEEGLLRSGGGETVYQPANPEVFTCRRQDGATQPYKPSHYMCNYSMEENGVNRDHSFRMNEMIVMADPADNDNPHNLDLQRDRVYYAWPPHKV